MIALLIFVFTATAHAETPDAAVTRVMSRVEKIVIKEKGKDAREIADLDRQAENLANDLKPFGYRAIPALSAAAQDLKRPAKVRLFAASFLALTRDPAALPPLEDVLLNRAQDPSARAMAAQSLPGLGAPSQAVSAALCAALTQEDLPRETLAAALVPLESLGCAEPAALLRIARSFGPRPAGSDLLLARAAAATLGKSRGLESGKAILSLISYFPARGDARAAAIFALDARRAELATWLAPEMLPAVIEALRSESERWDTMLALIRATLALGPDAGDSLSRLSRHPDAEVLASAAEAMVALKRVDAIPALEPIVAGAMNDPRYSPLPGRPDPAVSLARLEKAVAALRRAR